MINQIPFPQEDDLSQTSYSNNSHNTTPSKVYQSNPKMRGNQYYR